MKSLKILAVAIGLLFTLSVMSTYACDKTKTSAKSECSADMKKTCAKAGDTKACCTGDKTSAKSECSTTKTSAKSECCTTKKNAKTEAKNEIKGTKSTEVKAINN